jgi:adenylate cyclase class 2
MKYEVEQKHRVDDGWDLASRLAEYGAKLGEPIFQSDQYFAHPCRDFAKTDEALRIRAEYGQSFITYKGPKLDTSTKTRQELELPIEMVTDGPERFSELLEALGFSRVALVNKERRPFQINYAGREVDGAYDVVDGLGSFIELELQADEMQLEEAKRLIAELASKLDLGPSVRSSYLEMLLEKG